MFITEENFIPNLLNKHEKALEYVIDTYGWIVKSIVQKHLYNLKSHHEECINDIFLSVWNNIHHYDPTKSEFKNWLAAVAKYRAIDYQRKYVRDLNTSDISKLQLISKDNTYEEVTKHNLSKDFEDLLSCLKEEDRSIFLNLYVEEKNIDAISKETGLTRDILYNRISRSKCKLRKMFRIREGGSL